jgi:hypothetical protein
MPLHLLKLSVGAESVDDLKGWIKERVAQRKKRGESGHHVHITRMVPKRDAEILDGGSIYWVIKGQIMCREVVRGIEPFRDKEGINRCRLLMTPKVILVEPRPFRAFQGWRYLQDKDAPRDLEKLAPGARHMPEELRRELRGLGLL